MRQQSTQRQVTDTCKSVEFSLMDEFRQSSKSSEVFDIGSRCGVSRNGAFSKNLFGEVEVTRIPESGSRIRIPGCGDEVHTGPEAEPLWSNE